MHELRRRVPGDQGYTLVELLVSSAIFLIIVGVVATSLIAMLRTSDRENGQTNDLDAARNVLSLLDHSARYANAVTAPGTGTGGSYYVEYRTGNEGQQQTCYQWRFVPSSGKIQERTWEPPMTYVTGSTVTPSGWATRATGASLVGATPIWQLNPTSGNSIDSAAADADRVTLAVEFNVTQGAPAQTQQFQTSLTAINSSSSQPTAVCDAADSGIGRP